MSNTLEKLENLIKGVWKQSGNASIIAAKHTEFVIEPKVFLGNKMNPEVLKCLVSNYLADGSITKNIEIKGDRLIIKSPKGKPLVEVSDPKIIQEFLARQV
ncbi:MAG: hypothetical protein ABIH50_06985 [bacterium]